MIKHKNDGACLRCLQIIRKFPNFDQRLFEWFKDFQTMHPEFHVSCGGRGKKQQEIKKAEGKSRAGYGDSAHNYNCALDLFINGGDVAIYDKEWFESSLAPSVPSWLNWYGSPGSKFPELPHIEVRNWRLLRDKGMIQLVGDDDDDT